MITKKKDTIEVIGVPMDLGANIRGSNMGPAAVRIAQLHKKIEVLGYKIKDEGDLKVPVRETIEKEFAEEKYLSHIVNICKQLAERTEQAINQDRIPLSIGGDHSLAIGSISGVAKSLHAKNEKLGLIWFDAHADLNTPQTSPSGNIHGMPLSVLLGEGHPQLCSIGYGGAKVRPENACLIGIRAIDYQERLVCKNIGVKYFTMRDIDMRGLPKVMEEAINHASKNTNGIHVSFDIDGIDPMYAPGVSTPVTGGLSYRESHLALEIIAETKKLISMDFVELNPMTDRDHKSAHLLVELIQSLLGKSII